MSFTLKDLVEKPDKWFWDEPKDVEPDPRMVELIARSKADSGKPEHLDLIERAKRAMEGRLNKKINGAPQQPQGDPWWIWCEQKDAYREILYQKKKANPHNFNEEEIRWITARATKIVNIKEGWNARDHWILACRMAEQEVIKRRSKDG